jgi:Transglycosylase associated protein
VSGALLLTRTKVEPLDNGVRARTGWGSSGKPPLDQFFDISTWLTAIVGSIILLVIYRFLVGRGSGLRT